MRCGEFKEFIQFGYITAISFRRHICKLCVTRRLRIARKPRRPAKQERPEFLRLWTERPSQEVDHSEKACTNKYCDNEGPIPIVHFLKKTDSSKIYQTCDSCRDKAKQHRERKADEVVPPSFRHTGRILRGEAKPGFKDLTWDFWTETYR